MEALGFQLPKPTGASGTTAEVTELLLWAGPVSAHTQGPAALW